MLRDDGELSYYPGTWSLVRPGTRGWSLPGPGARTGGAETGHPDISDRLMAENNAMFSKQVVIIIRFELSAFEFLFIYPTHYPRSIDSCTLDRGRFVR